METSLRRASALATSLFALGFAGFAFGIAGCATKDASRLPVLGCEAVGPARPICAFQNPEDLVALPGGEALIVSEYGSMQGDRPGVLSLFGLARETRRLLYRGGAGDATEASEATWGADDCPGPPSEAFSPHGIHLAARADDSLQLLVVQHGGRESIEFFEVKGRGLGAELEWRGCVIAPAAAWLNSVAALPGGGFATTSMMPRGASETELSDAFRGGEAQGYVLEWMPGRGFRELPNTRTVLPNGIESTPDGRTLFVNVSGENAVRRYDLVRGVFDGEAAVPGPDNIRWSPGGSLLVASLQGGSLEDLALCTALTRGACPIPFAIVALDPETLETRVLYRNRGAPMGGGTVGIQVGPDLFVGSFAGDRLLRVRLAPESTPQ